MIAGGNSFDEGAFRGNVLDKESGKTSVNTARWSDLYKRYQSQFDMTLVKPSYLVCLIECIATEFLPLPPSLFSEFQRLTAFHE